MSAPPIFYAAAQVMFNPVLAMDTFVGKIQDEWRGDFPDFTQDSVGGVQIHFAEQGVDPQVRTTFAPRWSFKNADSTAGYLLTNRALALQTTRYTNSNDFIDLLMKALATLHKIVSLSYIDGVGFRTLDAIIPQVGKPLSFYLNPGLLGLYSEVDGELLQSIYQLTKKRVFGQLITRAIILSSQIGIPADLAPITLNFRDEVRELNGLHAVLDNDVIQQDRFPFSLPEAERRLRIVKEGINDAFYKSLAAESVSEWKRS
jgi:uncharacterized protein (TIGR04255 family)